jgi:carbamoyl-phosphate synthase large subunit
VSKKMGNACSVLVTGAGGGGTVEVIKALRARDYRVVAIDSSRYAAGFAFANAAYTVPEAIDKAFIPAVAQIIQAETPDFVVPLVDEEILVLHDLLASGTTPKFRLLTPSRSFCALSLDKWETFLALQAAGLPTPPTALASDCSSIHWPAVIKPRDGRGSRGVAYLDEAGDLDAYLGATKRKANDFVVQERVRGSEFTVSAVVALGGPTLAVVPKEVLIKRGVTTAGVTRVQPDLDALCRKVQDALHADGPFNLQLIVDSAGDSAGRPQIIEINPRYSTTVALTIASGIDEVDLVIQHALGKRVEAPAFQANLMMLRYYKQLYVPEGEWPPAQVDNRA